MEVRWPTIFWLFRHLKKHHPLQNNSHPLFAFKRLPTKNLPAYYCVYPIPQKNPTPPVRFVHNSSKTHPQPIHPIQAWPLAKATQANVLVAAQATGVPWRWVRRWHRRWNGETSWWVFLFRCGKWCWGVVGLGWVIFVGGLGLHVFVPKKTRRSAWKVVFVVFECLKHWGGPILIAFLLGDLKIPKNPRNFQAKVTTLPSVKTTWKIIPERCW